MGTVVSVNAGPGATVALVFDDVTRRLSEVQRTTRQARARVRVRIEVNGQPLHDKAEPDDRDGTDAIGGDVRLVQVHDVVGDHGDYWELPENVSWSINLELPAAPDRDGAGGVR
jgi:hypothetical protein